MGERVRRRSGHTIIVKLPTVKECGARVFLEELVLATDEHREESKAEASC